MKRIMIALLFLAPTLAWAEKAPNPADYTTVVHVQSSRLVSVCTNYVIVLGSGGQELNCHNLQHLNVVVNGKRFELSSKVEINAVFRTGDYKAKEDPWARRCRRSNTTRLTISFFQTERYAGTSSWVNRSKRG